jgi:hypothetical protein
VLAPFSSESTSNTALTCPDTSTSDNSLLDPIPEHKCSLFGPFFPGDFQSLDERPRFNEIPQPVDNFIGRQVELFEVVHTVMQHRLVNIMGLPGIGKTSLAKNAVQYMADRRLFKLGIIFFSMKSYKNCNVFMKKLVTNIMLSNF